MHKKYVNGLNSKLHLIVMKFDMYVKKYEEHAI